MKDTKLNNLTVADMLTAELEKMQVLDTGRRQGGAGGNGNLQGGGGNGATIDLGMARTRSEATDIIEKQLMSQGHAKTDADWGTLFNKAYDDNASVIDNLPLR